MIELDDEPDYVRAQTIAVGAWWRSNRDAGAWSSTTMEAARGARATAVPRRSPRPPSTERISVASAGGSVTEASDR
jgi:hypothetical protein